MKNIKEFKKSIRWEEYDLFYNTYGKISLEKRVDIYFELDEQEKTIYRKFYRKSWVPLTANSIKVIGFIFILYFFLFT